VTDEQFQGVLNAARCGEEWAVARLWRDLHPLLLRYLRGTAPADAADDLASDVWLEIARRLHRFQGGEQALRAWAFTIARHRAIDARRAARRRPTAPLADGEPPVTSTAPGPDRDVEAREALDAALRCLRRLPPDQAEVLTLRVVGGLDVAEVARIVGKRPGTVRVLQHRALRGLERQLAARGVTRGASPALFPEDAPLTA
jgi:RNA polymerase sigma-70 factor, ECF subfamily